MIINEEDAEYAKRRTCDLLAEAIEYEQKARELRKLSDELSIEIEKYFSFGKSKSQ